MKLRIVFPCLLVIANVQAQIAIGLGSTITQSFDGIGTSAGASLPTGWAVDKQSAVRTLGTFSAAGTATDASRLGGDNLASNASGGIYNFGAGTAASATDRSVGFLSTGSSTQSGNLYAYFQNTGSTTIPSLSLSYDIEKYRSGSNPAGFSVQLYYSTDGTSWTSAGASFLTSFGADSGNLGGSPSPLTATSITATALNLSIPAGGSLYLAWNYSVTSGSTTTNGQALGIDNVSLSAVPEPSTYAAVAGLSALAFAATRRRRR